MPSSSMELTWTPDFCLSCDKQTSGGAYCSQSCRLSDLETLWNWSNSSSPTQTVKVPASTECKRGSGFYLSPAINFDSYKTPTQLPTQASSFTTSSSLEANASKTLTSFSSRSSLSSTASDGSQQGQMSDQVHSELRAYTNSFDTTRNWRRRRTWS